MASSVYQFLTLLIEFYSTAIIIYIVMSWFPGAYESSLGRFLASITEPYLSPFRRIIPSIGMIDISPIVAIFLLNFAPYGLRVVFQMLGLF